MENLSTFVRTLGNQFIRGRKIFVGAVGLDGEVLDGNTSAGTSGQVLSTTGSGVQWITVGSSNVGELDDLTDVQTGTPSDGQLLRYDSESGLWYNWTPNYLDTTDGLNDLNGVVITSPVANQFLKYNGSNWVNANVLLSTLGDTSISSPSVDQILVYGQPLGGTPGVNVWYNKTHSFLTTATNIDDLNNVVISEQASGDILRYNGTNWVNVTFSSLENDTLDSVTDRGNTTTNAITVGGVNTDYVEFDTSVNLGGDESQGYMAWNSDVDTVSVYPYDSTWFNIGQDMHWHVKNGTAHTIERGQVVMATGAVGNSSKIEAGLMVADGTVSSKYILGVAIRDIASGEFGKVASQGIIRGIDTSAYQDGTLLWADPDTDGGFTSTEPDAPNLRLPIAFVVSAANNGAIAVRITTGNVLHELHDVDAPSPLTGDLLRYSALTGIWENWTPTYISGFTEADPIFVASPAYGISSTNITNWNTAYGWGNHATAGYLTSLPNHNHDDRYYTETEVNTLLAGKAAVSHTHEIEDITGLADSLDLKLESESDTLNSVTGRGNTTSNTIFVGSARGSSGTYGTGIYGDNSGASVQFGTSAAVDSLGIIGAYSSQFNINSKNGPLSFQYYGTEYMNISSAGALKLNSYGAGLLKTDANGNVTVDTNVYITADDQELTWEQSTKELSISDGNTVTLSGLASIADVEGYGYITTEVDTLNTVTSRGATTTNAITVGNYINFTTGSSIPVAAVSHHTNGYLYIKGGTSGAAIGDDGYGTSIYLPDSGDIQFTAGASERMRITSAGNVGIGTTSPSSILDVRGASAYFHLGNTSDTRYVDIGHWATGNIQVEAGNGNLYLKTQTSHYLALGTANSERLRITSGGAVLVNKTSSTGDIFQVQGSNNVFAARLDGSTTVGQSYGLRVRAGTNSVDSGLLVENTSGTDLFIVKGDGKVGIGTGSPYSNVTLQYTGNNSAGTYYGNLVLNATADSTWNRLRFDRGGTARFGVALSDQDKFVISNLYTNGTTADPDDTAFVILQNSNVGIGTTSPSYKLEVSNTSADNGIAVVSGTSSLSYLNLGDSTVKSAGGIRYSNSDDTLYLRANSQNYLTLNSSGNVGIGTTSPSAKLHVQGNGKFYSVIGTGDNVRTGLAHYDTTSSYAAGVGGQLVLGYIYNSSGSYTEGAIIKMYKENSTDGHYGSGLKFQVRNTGVALSTKMTLDPSGNVGIGTTSPTNKLDVAGAIKIDYDGTYGTGYGAIGFGGLTNGYNRVFGRTNTGDGLFLASATGRGIYFRANGGSTDHMTVASDGNVGIGTTSPAEKLNIYTATGRNFKVNQSTANVSILENDYSLELRSNSGYDLKLNANGSSSYGSVVITTNGSEVMRASSNGNVGIGTTSPSYKLHVNGSFNASNITAASYSVVAGKTTYKKSFSYIDTTGSAVAGLRGSSNGASAMFTFEMYGGSGQYQKVVYSCQNAGGNWYPYKVIDQGTNNLDVVASANGTTITFTFKAITSTQYYSPTVVIEHVGAAIEPSYL